LVGGGERDYINDVEEKERAKSFSSKPSEGRHPAEGVRDPLTVASLLLQKRQRGVVTKRGGCRETEGGSKQKRRGAGGGGGGGGGVCVA